MNEGPYLTWTLFNLLTLTSKFESPCQKISWHLPFDCCPFSHDTCCELKWIVPISANVFRQHLKWKICRISRDISPCVMESKFRNPANFSLYNPESGKILLMESGIQGCEIRNTAQGLSGIPLTMEIQNPSKYWQILESITWNPESTAWNPESKTVPDPLTWGEIKHYKTKYV